MRLVKIKKQMQKFCNPLNMKLLHSPPKTFKKIKRMKNFKDLSMQNFRQRILGGINQRDLNEENIQM